MAASGHRLTGIYRGHPLSLHVTLYIGHLHVLTSLAQKSSAATARQVLLWFAVLISALHFV